MPLSRPKGRKAPSTDAAQTWRRTRDAALLRDRCLLGAAHRAKTDVLLPAWRGWWNEQGPQPSGNAQTFDRKFCAAQPALKRT